MKIEILKVESEEWKTKCAPAQYEMTRRKGGLILIFLAEDSEEGKILNSLGRVFLKKEKKIRNIFKGLVWDQIYTIFSEDKPETGLRIYQIYGQNLSKTYKLAAYLVGLLAKV